MKKLESIAVDKLIPYVNNARVHSDEQVTQIAASIKEFGFNAPVLIDADNGIIAGHGRVAAAKKLGLAQVPCIRLDHLTEPQRKAYILADNKLALNSTWDDALLQIEIENLKTLGVDPELVGFHPSELKAFQPDYSMLNDADHNQTIQDFADGVKKAIQIEFDPADYEEAQELVKWHRERQHYVGGMLMALLRKEQKE